MNVCLFGTGEYYRIYKDCFRQESVVALLDNNPNVIGSRIDGIQVYSPMDINEFSFDKVFILSSYLEDMYRQLLELGVSNNKICTIYDINNSQRRFSKKKILTVYCTDIQYDSLQKSDRPQIAFLILNLGLGNGASLAGVRAAKILRKYYNVTVVTRRDGELRLDLVKSGIPVIVDENLYTKKLSELRWTDSYDLIFANGVDFYMTFDTKMEIPIVWWLHEGGPWYWFGMPDCVLENVSSKNIDTYLVSNIGKEQFSARCPHWPVKYLLYGVEDEYCYQATLQRKSERIIFALIGSIVPMKGQEVFLDAIALLDSSKLRECEFWIIGKDNKNTSYSKIIHEKIKRLDSVNVKLVDVVDRSILMKDIYPEISVLVCPSLDDTMPTVCAEAMMFHHPCIVSDMTGTARYITNKNGLICKAGDPLDLSRKIDWMVENGYRIKEMGENARMSYEKIFRMEVFERKLMKIVKEKIKVI